MKYYSTQPFLAWVLNRYFYGDDHFTYLAPFYPYRLANPNSSNPYVIYSLLYNPWKDNDEFDPVLSSKRMGLRKGVIAKSKDGIIDGNDESELKTVCDRIGTHLFCPVVYCVEMDDIESHRHMTANSGFVGSTEVLVTDLRGTEFELLLFDYDDEELCDLRSGKLSPPDVLATLKNHDVSAP